MPVAVLSQSIDGTHGLERDFFNDKNDRRAGMVEPIRHPSVIPPYACQSPDDRRQIADAIVEWDDRDVPEPTRGFVTGCGHGFLFPGINALAIRNEPVDVRGKATGIFTGSIDAGAFAGSIALGYIGDFAGFQALFLVASLTFLVGWTAWKLKGLRSID